MTEDVKPYGALTDAEIADRLREAEAADAPCRKFVVWKRNTFERVAQLAVVLHEKLGLLRRAINQFDGGCAPGCDSYSHAEDCRLDMATTLALQQAEIERLRAKLAAASE